MMPDDLCTFMHSEIYHPTRFLNEFEDLRGFPQANSDGAYTIVEQQVKSHSFRGPVTQVAADLYLNPEGEVEPMVSRIFMAPSAEPFQFSFSGGSSSRFLHELEGYFQRHKTPEENKLRIALNSLTGIAQQWYHCLQSENCITDFLSFKQYLLQSFPKTYDQVAFEAEKYHDYYSQTNYPTYENDSYSQSDCHTYADFLARKYHECFSQSNYLTYEYTPSKDTSTNYPAGFKITGLNGDFEDQSDEIKNACIQASKLCHKEGTCTTVSVTPTLLNGCSPTSLASEQKNSQGLTIKSSACENDTFSVKSEPIIAEIKNRNFPHEEFSQVNADFTSYILNSKAVNITSCQISGVEYTDSVKAQPIVFEFESKQAEKRFKDMQDILNEHIEEVEMSLEEKYSTDSLRVEKEAENLKKEAEGRKMKAATQVNRRFDEIQESLNENPTACHRKTRKKKLHSFTSHKKCRIKQTTKDYDMILHLKKTPAACPRTKRKKKPYSRRKRRKKRLYPPPLQRYKGFLTLALLIHEV